MNNAKVIQLFPISVFTSNIGVDEKDREFLTNLDFERMPSENGNFTKNKNVLDFEECKQLKNKIIKALNGYVRNYLQVSKNVNFYLQNSWVNEHLPTDWAQPHIHQNSLISGVYYIKTFENSGDITFLKPDGYTNLFHSSINIEFDNKDAHNTDRLSYQPVDGDLLIFPSHLMHMIGKNKNEQKRYSMGFNFFAEGELYSKDAKIDYLNLRK